MNKLTDDEREEITEWLNDNDYKSTTLMSIEKLLTSEQSGWEEVERLKEELRTTNITLSTVQGADEIHAKAMDFNLDMVQRLQTQLQDALKVMQEAVNDIDCEYPQTALIALEAAIQRIQEGTVNGISEG